MIDGGFLPVPRMRFGSRADVRVFGAATNAKAHFSPTVSICSASRYIVSMLLLCIVDGALTIELLDVNSEEVNPVMRFLLAQGHRHFLVGKYVLTAAGLSFLVVYKNWPVFGTRFRAGYLLPIFLGLYLMLLIYQLHLLGC